MKIIDDASLLPITGMNFDGNRMAPLGLLLVDGTPEYASVVRQAARQLGARLDTAQSAREAAAFLLEANRPCTHLLVGGALGREEFQWLKGMLDETALPPFSVITLGGEACPWPGARHLGSPTAVSLVDTILHAGLADPCSRPLDAADFASSLHAGGLRMRYQPILRCNDLQPVGLEALARLSHAQRGLLRPHDFLPLTLAASQERTITVIAASQIAMALRGGLLTDYLLQSLNVSLETFVHAPSVDRGLALCAMAGISPRRVVLEVLETMTAPDLKSVETALLAWKKAGFRVALDDAGPALPHWQDMLALPFDIVKLDGALLNSAEGLRLAGQICRIAVREGLEITAEGIEDAARLARARELGVHAVQGFHFARPLPAKDILTWLSAWQREGAAKTAAIALAEPGQ